MYQQASRGGATGGRVPEDSVLMEYVAAVRTDAGRKRPDNEDSFCLAPELGLFVVADGMGGHAAGEVASRIAVETIRESMANYLAGTNQPGTGQLLPPSSRRADFLLSSIRSANHAIFNAAQERREHANMGTTLVALLANGEHLTMANVGDSRIYRIQEGKIAQMSRDHSLVQEQVDRGLMSQREALTSTLRHLITRAVGLKDAVEVDLREETALPGDVFLLCSDGLSDLVDDEEMLATVRGHAGDLDSACQALVDRANYKGGDDNITAMLIRAQVRGA